MNKIIIFALGATAGSVVTWALVKEKYKRIADEEINFIVEHYHEKINSVDEEPEINNDEKTKRGIFEKETVNELTSIKEDESVFTDEEKEDYKEQLEDYGYTCDVAQPDDYTKPYVISPEEFGELAEGGYKTISLMYFSDFILAADDGEIVSDPENIIGDALNHFGEYEDDCVHVRNEKLECDYEILLSEKTFSEVYKGDS